MKNKLRKSFSAIFSSTTISRDFVEIKCSGFVYGNINDQIVSAISIFITTAYHKVHVVDWKVKEFIRFLEHVDQT